MATMDEKQAMQKALREYLDAGRLSKVMEVLHDICRDKGAEYCKQGTTADDIIGARWYGRAGHFQNLMDKIRTREF